MTEDSTRPPRSRLTRLGVPGGIAVGVTVLIALGAALFRHAGAQTNDVSLADMPKGVSVVPARATTYRASRRYVGTLEPWVSARIGPQLVSAYVSEVAVRPGAIVRRGDVLATLDCRATNATSLAVAQQARALEAQQLALARQATRFGNLLDGGFVAQNDVDQRQAASESEQARLLGARADLVGRSLAVSDCILRAPFDGEIGERTADPGAFVRPGSEIVSLVDRSTVRITLDAPETDYGIIAPGTAAHLRVLSTGRELDATVTRRSPAADPSTRTVRAEIDVPNLDLALPVDTTVEIRIEVGEPVAAVALPLNAADVRGHRANLFTVEGGIARSRRVEVLGEKGGTLYVAPELGAGTQVVVEGRALLVDRDRVAARVEEQPQ